MKIYVAGKTHDFQRVRDTQGLLEDLGHEITYDWTTNVEEQGGPGNEDQVPHELLERYALADWQGVDAADLIIALHHEKLFGTMIEIGMAIATTTPVILVGPFRESVFWHLPGVVRISETADLPDALDVLRPSTPSV